MRQRPEIGQEATREVVVESMMTARLFDREVHPVYATAWMVRHVEEAGRMLVEPYLALDEDATGYSIELIHERSARVGDPVRVVARVAAVDERSCTATFEVHARGVLIGRGTFVQRYIRMGALGTREGGASEL